MRFQGDLVEAARKRHGLSRFRLAVLVGVTDATIENVEKNKTDVAASTAYKIAHTLDVPLEDLFAESESVA